MDASFTYRLQIPFNELKRFEVEMVPQPELPNDPFQGNDFGELCRYISQHDVVLLQRCYKYPIAKMLKDACDMTGRKLIFETDDDYINLPSHNPCFREMSGPGVIEGYRQILGMADEVWVSTQELKEALFAFSRNIKVFPNNVENIFCGEFGKPSRGHSKETPDANGRFQIPVSHGLMTVPDYWEREGKKTRTVRIGYSGTPTHHEDFMTIKNRLERVVDKYSGKVWMVFVGDRWFPDNFNAGKGRVVHIPVSHYQMYLYHLRNIDIGIAPLLPNVFNMSKSPIKAVEYGAWGIPSVLPNYVTYTRDFTHGQNCLTYYNGIEFAESLEELINNQLMRENLGNAARDYVRDNRLERLHAQARFRAIYDLVSTTKPPKRFMPNVRATAEAAVKA